jgi:hypothetical protein
MDKSEEEYQLEMNSYRDLNTKLSYQANQNYDKYLITMSAGALALSLTFLSTILKDVHLKYILMLYLSWLGWGVAILAVLYSFLFSYCSHSKTINQINNRTIHQKKAGGWYTTTTKCLNWTAGISFFIASVLICIFIALNSKGVT